MVEGKNLFIRLWLPEHCPVETGGKQTHGKEKKKSKFIFLFSFILLFEYRCIQSCVSHSFLKNARLDFLFFLYSKAVLTVWDAECQRFHSYCDKFLASAWRQRQTKLSFNPPNSSFSWVNRRMHRVGGQWGFPWGGWDGDSERLLALWEDLKYFAIRNESNR